MRIRVIPRIPLSEVVDSLRDRLDRLDVHLRGEPTANQRVAAAPPTSLEDATTRARHYWDTLEKKRSSTPPPPKAKP